MIRKLVAAFVLAARRRARRNYRQVRVVRFDDSFLFRRFEFLWRDEYASPTGKHWHRPPWWRPFNAFVHWWCPTDDTGEGMHDHPRWSVTICLRGRMIEHTPWGSHELRPGSIVIRSRKYIHAFSIPDGYQGKTWTLFIVGRRDHAQNTYVVTPRGGAPGQVAAPVGVSR